jgi:membrane dipeptidase
LLTLGGHLERRGWNAAQIRAVLGGNFYRVAQETWSGAG